VRRIELVVAVSRMGNGGVLNYTTPARSCLRPASRRTALQRILVPSPRSAPKNPARVLGLGGGAGVTAGA